MNKTLTVLCGKCYVSVESIANRNGEEWGACPSCGQEDRAEDIFREAGEYHADNSFRNLFSGLEGSSLTVESPPQRQYRWIMRD